MLSDVLTKEVGKRWARTVKINDLIAYNVCVHDVYRKPLFSETFEPSLSDKRFGRQR